MASCVGYNLIGGAIPPRHVFNTSGSSIFLPRLVQVAGLYIVFTKKIQSIPKTGIIRALGTPNDHSALVRCTN